MNRMSLTPGSCRVGLYRFDQIWLAGDSSNTCKFDFVCLSASDSWASVYCPGGAGADCHIRIAVCLDLKRGTQRLLQYALANNTASWYAVVPNSGGWGPGNRYMLATAFNAQQNMQLFLFDIFGPLLAADYEIPLQLDVEFLALAQPIPSAGAPCAAPLLTLQNGFTNAIRLQLWDWTQ